MAVKVYDLAMVEDIRDIGGSNGLDVHELAMNANKRMDRDIIGIMTRWDSSPLVEVHADFNKITRWLNDLPYHKQQLFVNDYAIINIQHSENALLYTGHKHGVITLRVSDDYQIESTNIPEDELIEAKVLHGINSKQVYFQEKLTALKDIPFVSIFEDLGVVRRDLPMEALSIIPEENVGVSGTWGVYEIDLTEYIQLNQDNDLLLVNVIKSVVNIPKLEKFGSIEFDHAEFERKLCQDCENSDCDCVGECDESYDDIDEEEDDSEDSIDTEDMVDFHDLEEQYEIDNASTDRFNMDRFVSVLVEKGTLQNNSKIYVPVKWVKDPGDSYSFNM
jgi:hypothetical protein